MTRENALMQWHEQTLNGFLKEINHLIHHPAKYLDPALSREPSTGKTLYDRAESEVAEFVRDFPHLGTLQLPTIRYRFPTGLGESLDRSELRRLESDVRNLLRHVRPGQN